MSAETTVVIAGMGLVSPLGIGVQTNFVAACGGACGIRPLTRFDVEDFPQNQGGELATEDEDAIRERWPDLDIAFAMIRQAAEEAAGDADLADTGLVLGTNFGFMETLEWCWREQIDYAEMDPENVRVQQDVIADVAAALGIGGPRAQISMSCASGAAAVHLAAVWLRQGRCRRVLVVCYDALTEYCWCGLSNLRTITTDCLRPFDRERSGTIFGEGAAALLLSRDPEDDALAVVRGSAVNNNAYHLTAPAKEAEGSRRVMAAALDDADTPADAVKMICAHATGTAANDVTEAAAIINLLGKHSADVPVVAFKSNLGHLMGAAGLAEIVLTVASMRAGRLPPVVNLRDQDPECPLPVVREEPLEGAFGCAVTNSAGLGGNNASVVLAAGALPAEKPPAARPVYLQRVGWVLPPDIDSGAGLPVLDPAEWLGVDGQLADFTAKKYLQSVKGYLDPAAHYTLAAAALALGDQARQLAGDRFGVVFATQYGAPQSASRFYVQMVEKGHRFASPMIFPHGYANTAANLAAIEWELAGSHLVFNNVPDPAEALDYALDTLANGRADNLLLILAEAVDPAWLPSAWPVLNGALCCWLTVDAAAQAGPWQLEPEAWQAPDNRRGVLAPIFATWQ